MGWEHGDRVARARALRKAARKCGLPRDAWLSVRATSSRAALERLAAKCAASPGGTPAIEAAKEAAAAAWDALHISFSGPSARVLRRLTRTAAPKGKAKSKAKGKARGRARARVRVRPEEEEEAEVEEDVAATDAAAGDEDGAPGEGAVHDGAPRFRLRGKSFLITYNYRFLSFPFPDGKPCCASLEALWDAWCEWLRALTEALGIKHQTSTMEESLNAADAGRVHFHLKVNLKESASA